MSLHIIEFRCGWPKHSTVRRSPDNSAAWFWRIAIPACLLFWAAVGYGIYSLF